MPKKPSKTKKPGSDIPAARPFTTTDSVPVDIVKKNEPWAEYLLADGVTIRVRVRVEKFSRFPHADTNGAPVYSHQSMMDFEVVMPAAQGNA